METNYLIEFQIEGDDIADIARKIEAINSMILDGIPEGVTFRLIDPDELEEE